MPASEPLYKNEMHLAGTLAKDPQIRYTTAGKAVANLSVLTKYEQFSEYHRVTCWEKLAERAAECRKGDAVKIMGRLATRSWDDKATGQKKYVTEVIAFNLACRETNSVDTKGPETLQPPLTPDLTQNIHGLDVSDADVPF